MEFGLNQAAKICVRYQSVVETFEHSSTLSVAMYEFYYTVTIHTAGRSTLVKCEVRIVRGTG